MISLRLMAATSATDAAIQKKIFRSGNPLNLAPQTTVLIISNEEMDDILKIDGFTYKR